jgi:hypothetical protein
LVHMGSSLFNHKIQKFSAKQPQVYPIPSVPTTS